MCVRVMSPSGGRKPLKRGTQMRSTFWVTATTRARAWLRTSARLWNGAWSTALTHPHTTPTHIHTIEASLLSSLPSLSLAAGADLCVCAVLCDVALRYTKAAEAGGAQAQWNMGLCYNYGKGVSRDMAVARRWMQRAADQGHENAKNFLFKPFATEEE